MASSALVAVLLLGVVLGPAKPADPPLPPGSAADPVESLDEASPTRPVEAYPPARDTKGEGRASSAEPPSAAWWIPRVLLSPLYLVVEYGIRRPLGALVNHAERHHWPSTFLYATSFGTLGTEHEVLLLPEIDFEWGVRANAGLAFSWKNALVHGNDLHVSGAVGGPKWLQSAVHDRLARGARSAVRLDGEAGRRGDLEFHGIGPSSPANGRFFDYTHASAGLGYEERFWRSSLFESGAGVRGAHFGEDVPTSGYVLGYERMRAAIDTRRPREIQTGETVSDFVSPPGTGVRIEARGEHDTTRSSAWLRCGGGVGAYVDLNGRQRTLGLAVATELTTPLTGAIPFTELATLGGDEPFRAFRMYRLFDESYLAAKASYRWPIWASIDGALDATLGNVFGRYYDEFEPRLLRGSFTVGIETIAARDQALQLLLGFGTKTIADGFGVESVRVAFGTSRHF